LYEMKVTIMIAVITLWSKAISSEQRIREIEEVVQPVSTRILEDQDQIINEMRRLDYGATRLWFVRDLVECK